MTTRHIRVRDCVLMNSREVYSQDETRQRCCGEKKVMKRKRKRESEEAWAWERRGKGDEGERRREQRKTERVI